MAGILACQEAVEAIHRIDELRTLEEDWNCEGAHAIDSIACTVASMLVIRTWEECQRRHVEWEAPDIAATTAGGIHLVWGEVPGVEITVYPGVTQVRLMSRYEDGPNNVGLVASSMAVAVVVSYLGGTN